MQTDCMPSMSLPSIHEMFPEHLMRPTPYTASPPTPQHELTHSYTTSPIISHRRLSLSSPRQTASYPYPPRVHQIQEPRSHTDRGHIHLVNDGPRSAPTAPYRIEIPPAPQSPVRSRQRSASTASHGYSLRSAARPTRSHSEDYPEEPRRDAGCSSMIFSVSGYTARDAPSAGHREDGISASDEEDMGGDSTKKHVCTTCNKRFNRPSSLRIHLNTHTGATPFRCPWPHCGREFNVNSNMRRHLRNHTAVRPGQTPPPPKPYSPPVYLHSPPQPALSPPESNEEDSDDEDEVPEPAYSQRRSSFDYESSRYEKPRDDRYGYELYRMSYSHVRAPSRSVSPASSASSFSPRLIPISSARDPY